MSKSTRADDNEENVGSIELQGLQPPKLSEPRDYFGGYGQSSILCLLSSRAVRDEIMGINSKKGLYQEDKL